MGRGSEINLNFLLFLIEENISNQELFSGLKDIVSGESYCILKSHILHK